MTPSHVPSSRLVAPALGLALAATLVAGSAVQAQDEDILAAVEDFEQAMEALDIEAVRGLFCADQVDSLGGVGLAELLDEVPVFLDTELLLDGVTVEIDIESVEVVSRTDSEAVIDIEGSLVSEVDVDALLPMIEALFGLLGEEPEPGMVDAAMAQLAESLPETMDLTISGELELVRDGSGRWLICGELPVAGVSTADGA